MCKIEVVVHRCGCEAEQPITRCPSAQDAFADHHRRRLFDWSPRKQRRQSAFDKHYTEDGYCRDLDNVFFPSSMICPSHEVQYDGAQFFPTTNPLLHVDRADGLIFVETNPYDGSGKMFHQNRVPRTPQPTYHPRQTKAASSRPTRAPSPTITHCFPKIGSSSKKEKGSRSRRDRETKSRNEKTLRDAKRLDRERAKAKYENSRSVEDIRAHVLSRFREQQEQQLLLQQQQPLPPVPAIPRSYFEARAERCSLVPKPLKVVKSKTAPAVVTNATPVPSSSPYYTGRQVSISEPSSYKSSRYTDPQPSRTGRKEQPAPSPALSKAVAKYSLFPRSETRGDKREPSITSRQSSRARAPPPAPERRVVDPAACSSRRRSAIETQESPPRHRAHLSTQTEPSPSQLAESHPLYRCRDRTSYKQPRPTSPHSPPFVRTRVPSPSDDALQTITRGAATHPRVTWQDPECVGYLAGAGGGGSYHDYYTQRISSTTTTSSSSSSSRRYGSQSSREARSGRIATTTVAPLPLRQRKMYVDERQVWI